MKKKSLPWPRLFLALAFLIQCFVALASVYWFFELFTHYAPYYVLIALGFGIHQLIKKEWMWAACWFCLMVTNIIPLWPYFVYNATSSNQEPKLSVYAQNVYYKTTDSTEFFAQVDALSPDVFVVNEANAIWGSAQSEVLRGYPATALTTQAGVHGIFMGSKVEGTFTEIPLGNQVGLEFIPEDGSYRVLGVHPDAPLTPSWATDRNAQFADLVTYASSSDLPTVIIGDFNCTPWSPYFKTLIQDSGLIDSRLGFGFKSTWKANNPLFWLPIDHALVSPSIQVLNFDTFPTQISDHKGIFVELSYP